jgi:hypothetical protein
MTQSTKRTEANEAATERIQLADPVLVSVERAVDELPGMTPNTVLTSGPPLNWGEYQQGQADAIIGGAIFENLAESRADAIQKLETGEISLSSCHDHGCVGSIAGVHTASMPVFVVKDRESGSVGRCHFYEGHSRHRLNYGSYNEEVDEQLRFINDVVANVLSRAIDITGGVDLQPIIRQALRMSDDMHSRNNAATVLLTRELFPAILKLAQRDEVQQKKIDQTLTHLRENQYVFLRPAMAASKATAEAAHEVDGSSIVTAMSFNCSEFAIRVGGLGDQWFRAPMPMIDGKYFEQFSEEDVQYMGGDSVINATVGLGGLAQAAAFPLTEYQGGSPQQMIKRNEEMYKITTDEHPCYEIPYFQFRGVPTGIDVKKVVNEGITPVMNMGIPGKQGGQIGAGCLRAPMECFEKAYEQLTE